MDMAITWTIQRSRITPQSQYWPIVTCGEPFEFQENVTNWWRCKFVRIASCSNHCTPAWKTLPDRRGCSYMDRTINVRSS
jgi:hypothetical protein